MAELLLQPFSYDYMQRAFWICILVGGVCGFLSSYLMLKGWSLMGDALAHAIIPGVALSYLLSLPYAVGAFAAGLLASASMFIVKQTTALREDAVIGLIFTAFLAFGLVLSSINPLAINLPGIILGNILSIDRADTIQVSLIGLICLVILTVKWKEFVLIFFDENHAQSCGIRVVPMKIIFFTLLSAMTVAALQTVGACLVIAMVVTPGATAYLLTDRFGRLIILSVGFGMFSSGLGAYLSYFLDVPPGGFIVSIQTLLFLAVWVAAPKYGLFARRRAATAA